MSLISIYDAVGSIPALTSGLRIQCCHELWCRSQTWLRPSVAVAVAVAVASSCGSNLTPSLGISIRCEFGPKPPQKKKKTPLWTAPADLSATANLVPVVDDHTVGHILNGEEALKDKLILTSCFGFLCLATKTKQSKAKHD